MREKDAKAGRPPKPASQRKGGRIVVLVTESEKKAIVRAAGEKSVGAFMREKALGASHG